MCFTDGILSDDPVCHHVILQASQVTAPLFTYDTLRQRDPYSRLDSDASSLGQSLSPSQQVNKDCSPSQIMSEEKFKFIESGSKSVLLLCDAFCKTWYFSWNFGVKTWFDVGKWGIGRAEVRPNSFYHTYTQSSSFISKWEKVWVRRFRCQSKAPCYCNVLVKILLCYWCYCKKLYLFASFKN